jgi:hypothetical protein
MELGTLGYNSPTLYLNILQEPVACRERGTLGYNSPTLYLPSLSKSTTGISSVQGTWHGTLHTHYQLWSTVRSEL